MTARQTKNDWSPNICWAVSTPLMMSSSLRMHRSPYPITHRTNFISSLIPSSPLFLQAAGKREGVGLRLVSANYTVLHVVYWHGHCITSSPGCLCVSHWRAWYFFSCNLTYIIACGQDHSKDGCITLPFAGDSVSVLGMWYKRPQKSSYKKCRFTAFFLM